MTADLGITTASEPIVAAPASLPSAAGAHIRIDVSATGGVESWAQPVHAYFRRERDRWTLVGFERLPDGNPPGAVRVVTR